MFCSLFGSPAVKSSWNGIARALCLVVAKDNNWVIIENVGKPPISIRREVFWWWGWWFWGFFLQWGRYDCWRRCNRHIRCKWHGKGEWDIISPNSRIELHQIYLSNRFKNKQKEIFAFYRYVLKLCSWLQGILWKRNLNRFKVLLNKLKRSPQMSSKHLILEIAKITNFQNLWYTDKI